MDQPRGMMPKPADGHSKPPPLKPLVRAPREGKKPEETKEEKQSAVSAAVGSNVAAEPTNGKNGRQRRQPPPVNGAEKKQWEPRKEQAKTTNRADRPQGMKNGEQKPREKEGRRKGNGQNERNRGKPVSTRPEQKVTVMTNTVNNPNGFIICPRKPGEKLHIKSESPTHPWSSLFDERTSTGRGRQSPHSALAPPYNYNKDSMLVCPEYKQEYGSRWVNESVTLADVQAFRAETARKAELAEKKKEKNEVDALTASVSSLSTSSSNRRPVIYRYTAAVWNSIGILEAIHFELFMPDRPDLRFLGISHSRLPSDTLEGDYFLVYDVQPLTWNGCSIRMGSSSYPVGWMATRWGKMNFPIEESHGLAYIVQHSKTQDAEVAVSGLVDREFPLTADLFQDASIRVPDTLVTVSLRHTSGAHLYPVEHPRREEYARFLANKARNPRLEEPEGLSEYVRRVRSVRTTTQKEGKFPWKVRSLSAKDAARIDDRLGSFLNYGSMAGEEDVSFMHNLFQLGSCFRLAASKHKDADDYCDLQVDESVILKTLRDDFTESLAGCRPLLDLFYQAGGGAKIVEDNAHCTADNYAAAHVDGTFFTMNAQQSRAVHLYEAGTRAFSILSPPGSGKTTVAAAMAASVACALQPAVAVHEIVRDRRGNAVSRGGAAAAAARSGSGVQLLIAVQNVAVDNIGAALKTFAKGGAAVYNVKSMTKLDPHRPAPFDFFDNMDDASRKGWRMMKSGLDEMKKKNDKKYKGSADDYEKELTRAKSEYERDKKVDIVLATVEMILCKLFVTKSNFYLQTLSRVRRIIIDEASLLTEAALFCLIRRFPKAQFVFIGDDKQLPPFMYDPRMLGHELAGRSALSVVMKNGNMPIVALEEVYRAPPSLVEPYNRLSYEGRLLSRKPETRSGVLTRIDLIPPGYPQLLFVEVDGKQERNPATMSLYNEAERKAVISLLRKFPSTWKDQIMIICLYKEQKRRLQDSLGKDYTVLTVDSSQGKEKPIVILMTTRTEHAADMGFFCCKNRCTVAISRQKEALIVVGRSMTLSTNHPWSTVVNGDDFTRIDAESLNSNNILS